MGVEILDDASDLPGDSSRNGNAAQYGRLYDIDARRRLENRLEERRLRKEMQEFNFDL